MPRQTTTAKSPAPVASAWERYRGVGLDARLAAPSGRILSSGPSTPPHAASRVSNAMGGFFNFGGAAAAAGSDGKGKSKGKARLAGPKGSASSAALEATGWNQPSAPARRLESSPLLSSSSVAPLRRTGADPTAAAGMVPSTSRFSVRSIGGGAGRAKKRRWYMDLFRPTRDKVEDVLDSWWGRHGVLVLAPCVMVWIWCAVPFPKTHPDDPGVPWCEDTPEAPWCRPFALSPRSAASTTTDANFYFFLLFYYGLYLSVALVYITQLFSLYRLNWWPARLGAKTSYSIFWLLSIGAGFLLHRLRFDSLTAPGGSSDNDDDAQDDDDDIQWQRKTLWVTLAFASMAMPALVCLIGLRRSGRQTYRHSLTEAQKTFLERQLARRIPASYIRFLWFIATIGLSLVALLAGQGYASVYLSTLPHTGLDGTAYVTFWMTTVNLLAVISHWILEEKVRSRALLFANKYYYFLVYFIFYRNLFARLRSFDQFALVQLLSSFWVCIWYPLSMTSLSHRIVSWFNPPGRPGKSWEEYVESVGLAFYLRNLAQNVTMVAFLGWVSILHFGKNQALYPFFSFVEPTEQDDPPNRGTNDDPYNYRLTMLGSLAIWASELLTSWLARLLCRWTMGVDVTNLGLDEMRAFPDLLPTCVWTSVHVLMDMLLFLIKLNFR
ncbi:hypothetical protein BDZ90DRAFT_230155 [Jaminaea rosea]|uniref:Uncharacterized protein n=1 Tax=Jaminaea rosea TaxID=1569628 RepID=A0A316V6T3_9BASI|nr:hypothetical protein BDZ90DRAFT_230155 [Jaminaea rosea]PWN31165.1 hypothetical protein BDZ90DRAFT_230155 [Jaminaea rosea]